MIILGVETSCDETAAAVLKNDHNRIQILSKVISSSAQLQSKYGGVIPDQTAREQLKVIIPTIKESLEAAGTRHQDIDAIAVTAGPGLIGSLLVGVETAKTLSLVWNKPLIPVNHLIAHFYANWISQSLDSSHDSLPTFPAIGLLISGGHTDLILLTGHGKYQYLGGTRDDAAGECFDKCARILNLPYPGGPNLSKLAENGNPKRYKLPRPMLDSNNLDFSFSGLKTAFSRLVGSEFKIEPGHFDKKNQTWIQKPLQSQLGTKQLRAVSDLCASLEQAITDVLITKTLRAAQKYNIDQIIIAGGVASNTRIAKAFSCARPGTRLNKLCIPPPDLCTDNAAMVAACAFFLNKEVDPLRLQADPNLHL